MFGTTPSEVGAIFFLIPPDAIAPPRATSSAPRSGPLAAAYSIDWTVSAKPKGWASCFNRIALHRVHLFISSSRLRNRRADGSDPKQPFHSSMSSLPEAGPIIIKHQITERQASPRSAMSAEGVSTCSTRPHSSRNSC
jgi:hypothetical protein